MKNMLLPKTIIGLAFTLIIGLLLGCVDDGGDIIPPASPAENNPPIAEDQSAIVESCKSVAITLVASDPDDDELTWLIDGNPEHGSISATMPEITYTPDPDYYGNDSFTFLVNDSAADSNVAFVSIIIISIPKAPSDLTAASLPYNRIRLCWQNNSVNEEGFKIERKEGIDGSFELIQTNGANKTSFTDSGLTEGVSYYYRVHAFKVTGNSDYSEEVGGIPQANPFYTDFAVYTGPHTVKIGFASIEAVAAKIEYGSSPSYGNETELDVSGIEHAFIIDNLDKDTVYYYCVVGGEHLDFTRTFTTKDYYEINTYADTFVESLSGCNCSTPDAGFGDPWYMLNDVRGTDGYSGSMDVFSLRYCDPPGSQTFATVNWSGRMVMNGPGTDFVFFENGFKIYDSGTYGNYFMEPVVIFLSRDGLNWVAMPHDYDVEGYEKNGGPANETQFVADAPCWNGLEDGPGNGYGFGGAWPVFFNYDEDHVDPFYFSGFNPDDGSAGGDHFDLDDLDDDGEAGKIKRNGFKYLKFVAAWLVENPDTGENFPFPDNGSFDAAPDCDGVYARYFTDD